MTLWRTFKAAQAFGMNAYVFMPSFDLDMELARLNKLVSNSKTNPERTK